jgi:hypothetical protein
MTWKAEGMDTFLAGGEPLDLDVDHDFGVWHYYAHNRTLVTRAGGYAYEIDFEKIRTSAGMLDWIFQIHNKEWGAPTVVPDLVRAFQQLIDPQADYALSAKMRSYRRTSGKSGR